MLQAQPALVSQGRLVLLDLLARQGAWVRQDHQGQGRPERLVQPGRPVLLGSLVSPVQPGLVRLGPLDLQGLAPQA